MRVLAFDTTAPILSVGAAADAQRLCRRDVRTERGKGNFLDRAIGDVLREVGWSRPDVEGLALLTGPGSLTATRIGWATAAGWAQAVGIPVVGWTVPTVQKRAFGDDANGVGCCIHYRGDMFLLYDLSKSEGPPLRVQLTSNSHAACPPRTLTGPGILERRASWAAYCGTGTSIVDDTNAIIGADTLALWGEADLLQGRSLPTHTSPLEYGLPPDFKKLASA